jgi:hypothetical protein
VIINVEDDKIKMYNDDNDNDGIIAVEDTPHINNRMGAQPAINNSDDEINAKENDSKDNCNDDDDDSDDDDVDNNAIDNNADAGAPVCPKCSRRSLGWKN